MELGCTRGQLLVALMQLICTLCKLLLALMQLRTSISNRFTRRKQFLYIRIFGEFRVRCSKLLQSGGYALCSVRNLPTAIHSRLQACC
ncbi:hypothetical protein D3C74_423090 [compost metagenome]